jgi:hypothetical protein
MPNVAVSPYDVGLSYFPDDISLSAHLGDISSAVGTDVGGAIGTVFGGPVGTAAGGEAGKLVAGLFGGTGKYGTVQSEGAEQARIDAAVLGITKASSVPAAQFLLGQAQSDTSNYAKQATQTAVAQMQLQHPDIMNQAEAIGPQFDTADGVGVMTILLQNRIQFLDTYAGYDTTTTQPGSAAARALAQQLRTLPASGSIAGITSASVTIPGTTQQVPIVLLLGIGIAAYFALTKKRG